MSNLITAGSFDGILTNPELDAYPIPPSRTVQNIIRHSCDIVRSDISPAYQALLARCIRRNKQLVRTLRGLGRHEQADRVDFCQHPCKRPGGSSFIFSCHMPLCVFCGYQRQRRLAERWSRAAVGTPNPFFLTLTLRDFRHLAGVPRVLTGDFYQLRRRKYFREHCAGGFYCIECSYSPVRDRFHPHIHALLDAVDPSESWFSQTWKELTTAYIVDLRKVPRHEIKPTFLYMLKGPCDSLEPRAVSEVYSSLGGTPLFRAFGIVTRRHGLCRACRDKPRIGFGETCGHARHWE